MVDGSLSRTYAGLGATGDKSPYHTQLRVCEDLGDCLSEGGTAITRQDKSPDSIPYPAARSFIPPRGSLV
jgi:hypothetical protein